MNLKSRRIAAGLKQKDIAELIGIAQPTYCNIENKKRNPTVNTLVKIAAVLKCPVTELLDGDQEADED